MSATATAGAPAPTQKAPHVGLVIAGLMLGILLAALDQTVVGTSLFKIVGDIGGFEHFSWLISAYLLASVIVIPIAGKLSDIYGRRPIYMAGMGIFLVGSVLCGTATNIYQLIGYRALQGLGGGAIFPVALATIADLYPPSERGRIGGIFGAVFGLSSVIGPFLGGWIVDSVHIANIASWRWVFYVNLPVGLIGILMVGMFFPRIQTKHTARIDFAGIVTLTLALLSGLMITVWGGNTYGWTSWQILGLGALSVTMFASFIMIEQRAADPILPLAMFKNPIFTVSAIASLFSGAVMFAIITFMPTYLQGVVGISATYAGTALIPLSIGIVGGAGSSGALMKKFGYKPFAVGGFVLAIIGYLLLSTLGDAPKIWSAIAYMFILGLGIGFTIQTFIIAVQNAIQRRYVGVGTSSITLFRMLGATLGVTVLGVILNRRLAEEIPARVPPAALEQMLQNPFINGEVGRIPSLLVQPGFIANTPPEVVEGIKAAYSAGMHELFLIAAGLAVVALLVTVTLKVIPMKSAEEYKAEGVAAPVVEI